ncbi:MAG: MFS transporter [SAR202 cluster bacterium]|nr:MFS transporter [SAR202 cluster bacterium]
MFLVGGNFLLASSLLWLSGLAEWPSDAAIAAPLLAAGLGGALFEPVAHSVVMGSAPPDRLGTASASIAMGRQAAYAVGVALMGTVFTIRERFYAVEFTNRGYTPTGVNALSIQHAFGDALIVCAVLATGAALVSMLLRPESQGPRRAVSGTVS